MEHAHPDVVVERVGGFDAVRGRDAVLEWLKPEALEDPHLKVEEISENGDRYLSRLTMTTRGAASGLEMTLPVFQVSTFDGDQVVRWQNFLDETEARAAAGLGG